MNLTSKIACTLIIICSSILILSTGRTNIRNFEKVQASIKEIYLDRLVVEGIIFDLSTLLHKKEISILSKDKNFYANENKLINNQIAKHLESFRATNLTPYEEKILEDFTLGISNLQSSENDIDFNQAHSEKIVKLQNDLKILLGIQLSEGKIKLKTSDKAVESMYEIESIENYALIILALLIIIIIFIPSSLGANKENT